MTTTNERLAVLATSIASVAVLRSLGSEKLFVRLGATAAANQSRFLESGKILAVLNENRTKGTLKQLVRSKLGEDFAEEIGHGYKAAVCFSGLVLKNHLPESAFDLCRTSWLLPVSAVLNHYEKEKVPADAQTSVLADICKILSDRPVDAQSKLDEIKDQVIPKKEKEEKEEKGEGNSGGAEKSEAEPVAEAPDMTALATIATLGELAGVLFTGATEDQLNSAAPYLDKLPETVREPLVVVFGERVKALRMETGSACDVLKITLHGGEVLVAPNPAGEMAVAA